MSLLARQRLASHGISSMSHQERDRQLPARHMQRSYHVWVSCSLVRSISLHHSSLSFFLRGYCLVSAVAPLRNDAVVTLGGKSAVHHCQSFHVIEYFWLHLRSVMMSFWVLLWRNALTLTAFAPDRSSGFWGGHICSCVDFVVYMIVSSDKKISKKIHSSGIGRRSANLTAGAI